MRNTVVVKMTSVVLAGAVLLSGCASTTLIQSTPEGAKVYLDGESVGITPYSHTDTKIVGSTTSVKLEKEGYEPFYTYFSRNEQADVGAIIGGVFVWVPFLWIMKYKPTHTYEMSPVRDNLSLVSPVKSRNNLSKADQLRELKQLIDEKVLTQEEYEVEKKKILDDK